MDTRKEYSFMLGKNLKRLPNDEEPFIDLFINLRLKDLLHPGFPIINKGILLFIQQNNAKIFSNNALLFHIPFFNIILSTINLCSSKGYLRKSLLKTLFSFFTKLFLNAIFCKRK